MINLIPNPGFESNTTGWANFGSTSIARSTAQANTGAASCLMARDGTGNKGVQTATSSKVAVNASTKYTFECWVYAETEPSTVVLRMQYYNASGASGSATSNYVATGVAVPQGVWTRIRFTTRSDTAGVGFVGYAYTTSGTNPSNVYYDDFALFKTPNQNRSFQLRPISQ